MARIDTKARINIQARIDIKARINIRAEQLKSSNSSLLFRLILCLSRVTSKGPHFSQHILLMLRTLGGAQHSGNAVRKGKLLHPSELLMAPALALCNSVLG